MEVSLAYVALGGAWYLAGLFCLVGLSQTPNCRGLARKALPEASQTPSKWFILLISYLCQVLHHGLSMFSISLSLMSSQGQIYILMVLFSESTTPFVNIRWYLDVAGRKSSTIYIYNGIALFFGWLADMTSTCDDFRLQGFFCSSIFLPTCLTTLMR
ncbi:hypothetical protein Goari_010811 [Gossypium aridum]|uniref:TLC domain-containing protein n=1 Tax=Gossypium aridum TaxID=34290 RepID=A0A7J8WVR3_GOSAI|nr:hypothetical protein [Gossypium aridum]